MALQNTFRLAISDEFFDAYSRLPRNTQEKVSKFINLFRQDPTSPASTTKPSKTARAS